jgi:hypothetical protein
MYHRFVRCVTAMIRKDIATSSVFKFTVLSMTRDLVKEFQDAYSPPPLFPFLPLWRS